MNAGKINLLFICIFCIYLYINNMLILFVVLPPTRLQSMACAHQKYFPPKTVTPQVYLGLANQMGVARGDPTYLFDKNLVFQNDLISRHQDWQDLILILVVHRWLIGITYCWYRYVPPIRVGFWPLSSLNKGIIFIKFPIYVGATLDK